MKIDIIVIDMRSVSDKIVIFNVLFQGLHSSVLRFHNKV